MATIKPRESAPSVFKDFVEDKPDPERFARAEAMAKEIFRKAEKAKFEMDKRARDYRFC
ncbi:MAG: hypothetical protein HQM06_00925 [Magnetococcales bacterium]|nr:hypothetical protein [Magnetococcales bacterium]